jgi:predicted Ser/Thr protein kinase
MLPAVTEPNDRAKAELTETAVDSGGKSAPTGGRPAEAGIGAGSVLGRYVVVDKIGVGGMGMVFRARDPDLHREVAVKVLRVDVARDAGGYVERRLLREAQAMARLSHENLVVVHDVGVAAGQVFLAMELVKGVTLRQWLADGERPWRERLATVVQAGRGLAAAHGCGVVHRDFKPDNVLVSANGKVKVVDFGLARAAEEEEVAEAGAAARGDMLVASLTVTGAVMGTPAYMAPEQLDGRGADFRSDQFAFAVTAWQVLYGERPFAGNDVVTLRAAVARAVTGPLPAATEVPPAIEQTLRRALSQDPAARFGSLDELLAELESVAAGAVATGAGAASGAGAAAGVSADAAVDLASAETVASPWRLLSGKPDEATATPVARPVWSWQRQLTAAVAVLLVAAATAAGVLLLRRPAPAPAAVTPDKEGPTTQEMMAFVTELLRAASDSSDKAPGEATPPGRQRRGRRTEAKGDEQSGANSEWERQLERLGEISPAVAKEIAEAAQAEGLAAAAEAQRDGEAAAEHARQVREAAMERAFLRHGVPVPPGAPGLPPLPPAPPAPEAEPGAEPEAEPGPELELDIDPQELIADALDEDDLDACFADVARRKLGEGVVVLKLTVSADGHVLQAVPEQNDFPKTTAAVCLVHMAKGLHLEAPGRSLVLRYPFKYTPEH